VRIARASLCTRVQEQEQLSTRNYARSIAIFLEFIFLFLKQPLTHAMQRQTMDLLNK
jgi:hypothetical protein